MENPVDKENHSGETAFDLGKVFSSLSEIWKAMEDANLRMRRAIQRMLLKILFAAVCLAVVTLIAQAFRSRLATAIIGYVVTLFLLACFAFAHLLAKGLEYIELRTPTKILRLPISFGFGAVVLFRAVILFVAQFVVDVYVSLCSGGLHGFSAAIEKSVALSLFCLCIALLNLTNEGESKSIHLAARAMSTYGYFFFLASICSLSLAMFSVGAFQVSVRIFEWPPWFFAIESREYVQAGLRQYSLVSGPSLLATIPLSVGVIGTSKPGELRDDVTHLVVALAGFICYLLLAYMA